MKQSELAAEIEALIEETLREQRAAPAHWLVHTVVSRHPAIEGEDVPFYVLCAFEHCRDTVRQVLRDYRPREEDEDENRQLVLPGYKRVRTRYLVERNREDIVIPTEQMTAAELRSKAKEYRSMGVGCFEHADELERLASDREAEGGTE